MRPFVVVSLVLHLGAAGAFYCSTVATRAPERAAAPFLSGVIDTTPVADAPPPVPPLPPAPIAEEPPLRADGVETFDDTAWPAVEHAPTTASLSITKPHRLARPLLAKPQAAPPVEAPLPPPSLVPTPAPAPPRPAPTAARVDRDASPRVRYPFRARRAGQEGRVVVRVTVTAQGAAGHVEVAESSGHPILDRAALAAVKRWTFVAATRDGKAVPARLRVPIDFVLRDATR